MNLRNLSIAEMIAVSASWSDPRRGRRAFLATPLMAPLLPEVESAHGDLVALSPNGDTESAERELTELQNRAVSTDRLHDRKGGGVELVLQGAEKLADTDEERATIADLRRRLFPDGAQVFATSYLAEAGNAERVENELKDPTLSAVLEGITVHPGRTLGDEARAFVKAGRDLGVIESQKAALSATTASPAGSSPSRRAAVASARNRWIQVVGVVQANARLLKGEAAAGFSPVMVEFEKTLARVEERVARRQAAKTEVKAEEKTPPVEPQAPATPAEKLAPTG